MVTQRGAFAGAVPLPPARLAGSLVEMVCKARQTYREAEALDASVRLSRASSRATYRVVGLELQAVSIDFSWSPIAPSAPDSAVPGPAVGATNFPCTCFAPERKAV